MKQSVNRTSLTLIEITDSQGFSMPQFPENRTTFKACENAEYFKPQDEQTKGEQEKACSFKASGWVADGGGVMQELVWWFDLVFLYAVYSLEIIKTK